MMDNSKEILASNIRRLLNEHNKTQNGLADYVGVSKTAVSEWISAKKYPRVEKIQAIADFFDVYRTDITERHVSNKSKGVRIPVLGRVIAGIPIEAIEEIIDYEEITEQMARTGDFFALQIKGDSMEPQMSEGDVVIVRKQEDLDSGQIGIVLVNGDEATVKKVVKKENGIMLVPFNGDKYEPWFYDQYDIETKPVKIIGRVVELRKKY